MEVLDNGVGFDVADPRKDRHFGIALMEERVSMAGGEMEIGSQPGSGVRVSASFPMDRTPLGGIG